MFVDTNVLLLSRLPGDAESVAARDLLERAFSDQERACISRQILREYLSAATRPEPRGHARSMPEALADVAWMLERFDILEDGASVTRILTTLCRETPVAGRKIHDANIVATMLAHGEHRLATRNEKDFRRYGDHIEIVVA